MIDLRSDTVTQPGRAMREAMAVAPLGDDVYGEDPSINRLEAFAAELLGKEAALFATSGTQSNLLALLTHCARGDEYIVGQDAHTYRYEGGGAAVLGGIQPQPLSFQPDGTLDLEEVAATIKPDDFHFARSRLVCLENTTGGRVLPRGYLDDARALCDARDLALHLDGARLFNAVVAQQTTAEALAAPFDTVSICLSKGLGAPVGSLLLGPAAFIAQARRWRKMLGGGLRQAGMLAAAGEYALANHVSRLAQDHDAAGRVAKALNTRYGEQSATHATNMVHVNLVKTSYGSLRSALAQAGIRVERPRWVFHLDVPTGSVDKIVDVIRLSQ